MTNLHTILQHYCTFRPSYSGIVLAGEAAAGKYPYTNKKLQSREWEVETVVHHFFTYPMGVKEAVPGLEIGHYVDDKVIPSRSEIRMKAPFQNIDDCAYSYYAFLLTLQAYLMGGNVGRLFIGRTQEPNDLVVVRYRQPLAEVMLSDWKKVKEEAVKQDAVETNVRQAIMF